MARIRPAVCEQEGAVVRAVRTGLWPGALREHAAVCEACAEAMAIAAFLQAPAAPAAPEPGLMWWKLELRARREKALRAMRPLALAEHSAACLLGGALLGGIVWLGSIPSVLGLAAAAAAAVLGLFAGSAILLAARG
jgi:hypothetical protein